MSHPCSGSSISVSNTYSRRKFFTLYPYARRSTAPFLAILSLNHLNVVQIKAQGIKAYQRIDDQYRLDYFMQFQPVESRNINKVSAVQKTI